MDHYKLDCSPELAQRFWALCKKNGQTPGQVIRRYMADEVERATGVVIDPAPKRAGSAVAPARHSLD